MEDEAPIADLHDAKCFDKISDNKSVAVAWLLMASFGYYKRAAPILSDGMYDWLAAFIVRHWDEIEHPHKSLMTKESLAETSSLELHDNEYPQISKRAYLRLNDELIDYGRGRSSSA